MSDELVPLSKGKEPHLVVKANGESVYMVPLGGEVYPFIHRSQCKTCQLVPEARVEVEQKMLSGYSPKKAYDTLPPEHREKTSYQSVLNHHKEHMPWQSYVGRHAIDAQALAMGIDPYEGEEILNNHLFFLRRGVAMADFSMSKGDQHPTIGEAIQMSKILLDYEARAGNNVTNHLWRQLLDRVWQVVLKVTSDDQADAIARIISADPSVASLRADLEKAMVEGRTGQPE